MSYLPAYAVPGVLGLVSLPFLARVLGPEEFGIYGMAVVLQGVALTLVADPTSNALRRLFAQAEVERSHPELVRAGFGLALLLSGSVVLLALVAGAALALDGRSATAALVVSSVGSISLFGLFQYMITTQYVRENVRSTATAQVAHSVLKTTGLILGAVAIGSAAGPFVGYSVVLVPLLVSGARWIRGDASPLVSVALWRNLVAFGGPLLVVSLAWVLLNGLDRVVLSIFDSESAAGKYVYTYLIVDGALSLAGMAVHYAVYPRVTRSWEADEVGDTRGLIRHANDLFLVVAGGVIALVAVLGDAALVALAGENFRVSTTAILAIALGVTFYRLGEFEAIGFHLALVPRRLARRFLLAAAISVPLTFALVAALGVTGAALATLLGYFAFWCAVRIGNPLDAVCNYPWRRLLTVAVWIAAISAAAGLASTEGLVYGLAIAVLAPAGLAWGAYRDLA